MADHRRRGRLTKTHDRIERHHLARRRSRVELLEVVRLRAELLIGLHVHAIRAVAKVEVVHVLRAEKRRHRIGNLSHRQAEAACAIAIDVDHELRVVRGERRVQSRDLPRRVAGAHQLTRGISEHADVAARLIEHFELEAAERREALNRRGRHRNDQRAGNAHQLRKQPTEHRLQRLRLLATLFEALQSHEHQALIRRGSAEAEAGHREHRRDLRLSRDDAFGLLHDVGRVLERRAAGSLHDRDEVAFVFFGHKRGGHAGVDDPRADERRHEEEQHRHAPPQGEAHHLHVEVGARLDHAVDHGKQPGGLVRLVIEQQRRQRGRKRDRVEDRQHHRKRNRQRELLIEATSRARKEGHRHKHGDEHEADDDHGREHFAHGVDRRMRRVLLLFAHVSFDVLDDHDRVVDDDTGREHDAKERERVDREAKQLHERKRADERHRNGDGRNNRAAPVLQEQEHDEHDETDRFEQRPEHFNDRLTHDRDVVERELPLQSGRKVLLEARHFNLHALEHFDRVGRGQQLHTDTRRFETTKAQAR